VGPPGLSAFTILTLLRRMPYEFTTDRERLDVRAIHAFLTTSYWAAGRDLATVERSMESSLCFGYLMNGETVAFARVVTDTVTIGHVADVFVLPAHRGRGLGKRLIEGILADPRLQSVRHWTLRTKDAHGLYRQYGFEGFPESETWMHRCGGGGGGGGGP